MKTFCALLAASALSIMVAAPADAANLKRCGTVKLGKQPYKVTVTGFTCAQGKRVLREARLGRETSQGYFCGSAGMGTAGIQCGNAKKVVLAVPARE